MMKRFGISACALVSFATLILPCLAQDNPWNGSWQRDPASLKFDGSTFSVAMGPDGYTVTREGAADPKMVCNGQPQARPGGMETACTKTESGYTLDSTHNGKQTSRVTVELSADGNTSILKAEIFPQSGDPFTRTITMVTETDVTPHPSPSTTSMTFHKS